jgi:hypothetical protein
VNAEPTTAIPVELFKLNAGLANLTVNEYVAVDVPEELVDVIVYVVAEETPVGVPPIAPEVVLKVIPAGNVGETAKLAIAPPVVVTLGPVKDVPTIAVADVADRVKVGRASFTVNEYVAVDVPDELVEVMVKVVAEEIATGVPPIAPVVVLNVMPVGNVGEIAKLAIAPPVGNTEGPVNALNAMAFPEVADKVNVGGANLTVSEYVAVEVPEELVDVIVYEPIDGLPLAVPLMTPVVVLKVNPAGSVPEIAKLAIAPPVERMVGPVN